MNRIAETNHPIHEILAGRWSPCAFADRPVEHQKLLSCLEAARWAPSSFNEQPWHLVIATKSDADEYDRLFGCLVEGNQAWAKNADVLILAIAAKKFSRNGKPNRHCTHDVGLALENLAIQAHVSGLATHMMAGFEVAKARQTYEISEDYEPITAMALGYPGDPADLPENLRDRDNAPRKRKELAEFVYSGRFGQVAPVVNGG